MQLLQVTLLFNDSRVLPPVALSSQVRSHRLTSLTPGRLYKIGVSTFSGPNQRAQFIKGRTGETLPLTNPLSPLRLSGTEAPPLPDSLPPPNPLSSPPPLALPCSSQQGGEPSPGGPPAWTCNRSWGATGVLDPWRRRPGPVRGLAVHHRKSVSRKKHTKTVNHPSEERQEPKKED